MTTNLLRHAAQLELLALMHLAKLRPELNPTELAQEHERLIALVQSESAIARAETIIKLRLRNHDSNDTETHS